MTECPFLVITCRKVVQRRWISGSYFGEEHFNIERLNFNLGKTNLVWNKKRMVVCQFCFWSRRTLNLFIKIFFAFRTLNYMCTSEAKKTEDVFLLPVAQLLVRFLSFGFVTFFFVWFCFSDEVIHMMTSQTFILEDERKQSSISEIKVSISKRIFTDKG